MSMMGSIAAMMTERDTYDSAADLSEFERRIRCTVAELLERGCRLPCECGRSAPVEQVAATMSVGSKCDRACAEACGLTCSCACGGANHGAAFDVASGGGALW